MNKKSITILFSMMLYASVFSFPVNLELNEDLAPPSASGNSPSQKTSLVPKGNGRGDLSGITATVQSSPPSSSKKGKKTLVEEDDFIETGENEYLAPVSASSNSKTQKPSLVPKGKGGYDVAVVTPILNTPPSSHPKNARTLVDEDDFIETGENEYLTPPSSNSVSGAGQKSNLKPAGNNKGITEEERLAAQAKYKETHPDSAPPPTLPQSSSSKKKKTLVDEDEDFEEEFDNGEMMDLVPPSSSGNGGRTQPPPKPKPMGTHGDGSATVAIPNKVGVAVPNVPVGVSNQVGSVKRLVDDDEEFDGIEDEDISEEEDLAPPSSAGLGKKPVTVAMTFKPNMHNGAIKCYENCSIKAPYDCFKVDTKSYKKMPNSVRSACASKCKDLKFCE